MVDTLTCPNCDRELPRRAMDCPHCGANIALATAVAERKVVRQTETQPLPPLAPELLMPRLGEFLIQYGYISQVQLEAGLAYQRDEAQLGQPMLLGQALIALGLLERADLDAAITEQIVMLQETLRKSNRELDSRVRARTAELQTALDRLTELGELKNNFISNVSHELRTPLTHLSGYLELMAEGALGAVTEQQNTALEVMLRAYKRLDALIENLIQVAVMAKGELNVTPTPCAPGALAAEALTRNAQLAREHQVTLHAPEAAALPSVLADSEKITWALEQLVENGIKFNQAKGEVWLRLYASAGGVRFEVEDTGHGIPAERREEIFEPFHQLDGSNTRRVGGAGLGLALVRQIIESHDSRIEVRSEPGRGTCFRFVLKTAGAG